MKCQQGYSLIELIVVLCLIMGLSLTALVKSTEILKLAGISSQSKLIQSLISNAIISAYRQNAEFRLQVTQDRIRLLKGNKLVDQHIIRKNIVLSKASEPATSAWTEAIYPGGSQSPFTLQLTSGIHTCLVTVSLRGRVSRKCL